MNEGEFKKRFRAIEADSTKSLDPDALDEILPIIEEAKRNFPATKEHLEYWASLPPETRQKLLYLYPREDIRSCAVLDWFLKWFGLPESQSHEP